MKKLTVAQIRENNIYKLAKRSKNFETDVNIFNKARKAFNSFYRLAGFSERLFNINNDYELYRRYQGKRLEAMEAREDAWIKRCNEYLKEFNAEVYYNGICPSIIEKKENNSGCVNDLFLTSWY